MGEAPCFRIQEEAYTRLWSQKLEAGDGFPSGSFVDTIEPLASHGHDTELESSCRSSESKHRCQDDSSRPGRIRTPTAPHSGYVIHY